MRASINKFSKLSNRYISTLFIALIGISLTVYALYFTYQNDKNKYAEQRIQAISIISDISASFSTDINSFNYLGNYFSAAGNSAIARFSEFAINFLDENNTFQVLMYAPLVTPNDLDNYLSGINALGYPKRVSQYREDGEYEEALVSEQSFPIDLIENFSRDEIPFGMDLISNQDWINNLYAARDSSLPTAIHVNLRGKSFYWLVKALYENDDAIQGNVSGYLVASMDPQEGMKKILDDKELSDYTIEIVDRLLENTPANHSLNNHKEVEELISYGTNDIAFGGNSLSILVKGQEFEQLNWNWSAQYFFILLFGALLTLISSITFWIISNRADKFKELYDKLKESQDQLVQNEKMASLGQMIAGVAHEINTPLGYINNNISMLKEHMIDINSMFKNIEWFYKEPNLTGNKAIQQLKVLIKKYRSEEYNEKQDEIIELVGDTKDGIGDISEIVRSLKDFSRLDRQQQESFNLHDGIESTLKIANSIVVKSGVTVNKSFGEIDNILCSPSKINQVFLNIITNACQAMSQGGVLDISTEFTDNDFVKVIFKDNGDGMSDETKNRLFDPFYTTKPIGEGTGLGMSVSFKIIQEHNGSFDVQSELGVGTVISILLPK